MEPLNIFITGGTSALGRELTRQLTARGHHVIALTVGSQGGALVHQDGGVPAYSDPFRPGEIRSMLLMSKADVVLPLMTQLVNNFPHKDTDWDTNVRVLTDGTDAVLQAASETGVKFIVYPSYSLLYGESHGSAATEESPLHPPSILRAAVDAEKRVLGSSVPACVLRAGLIYAGDDTGTMALKEALQAGRSVYMGSGHNVKSWIHAADLARAVVLAVEQQPQGETFNVADNRPATPAELVRQLAGGLGVSAPGSLSGFMLNRMTTETQRELVDLSQTVNSDKIRSALGWTPRYADYLAGIEQTLLAWRSEAPLQA